MKLQVSFPFKDNEEHGSSKVIWPVPFPGKCEHPRPAICSMPIYSSTMAGDVWGQWFACCITQQPPQVIHWQEKVQIVYCAHFSWVWVIVSCNFWQLSIWYFQWKHKIHILSTLSHGKCAQHIATNPSSWCMILTSADNEEGCENERNCVLEMGKQLIPKTNIV